MEIKTKYDIGQKVIQCVYEDDKIQFIKEIVITSNGYHYILSESTSLFNESELVGIE